jgi:hypothetical protein
MQVIAACRIVSESVTASVTSSAAKAILNGHPRQPNNFTIRNRFLCQISLNTPLSEYMIYHQCEVFTALRYAKTHILLLNPYFAADSYSMIVE